MHANESDGTSVSGGRSRRQGRTVTDYSETARRRPRATGVQYARRGGACRVPLRTTIEVGPMTVERTVAGQYEWRDAALQTPRRRRRDGRREQGVAEG